VTFEPDPVDTSGIEPFGDLTHLPERLARNVHDRWARERIAAGWRWGPSRDDAAKTHPDLVPYDQLAESEKDLDRRTAEETVRTLLALGYRIEPPAAGAGSDDAIAARPPVEGPAPADLAQLDLAALLTLWRTHDAATWAVSPEPYRLLVERLRATGEPLLAYDVVQEGLEHCPDDLRLRQLHALALADSGVTERANTLLARLVAEGHEDEETVGMLARTHKDLALRACEAGERARHLRLAREWYESSYRRTGGYWTGINAATLAALEGSPSAAILAAQVYDQCMAYLSRIETEGGDRYWPIATLGEACLVMERWSEAERWYRMGSDVGLGRSRDLSSTRRNARLLLGLPGVPEDVAARIESSFRIPRVVMFAGHMIDSPGRGRPRFPPDVEGDVAQQIKARLGGGEAPIGFASAACGSDILFLEAVLDLGGEIHVVLPYDIDQFEADSVDILPGSDWPARFRRALDRATRVVVASERCQTRSAIRGATAASKRIRTERAASGIK